MYVTETLWKSKVRFMTKFLRGLSLSLLVLAFWASWVAWGPSSIRSEILLDVLGVTRIPSPPTYRRFKKRGQKIIQRGSTARLTCSSPWFHKNNFFWIFTEDLIENSGICRYVGPIQEKYISPEIFIGVELDECLTNNSGVFGSRQVS